MDQTVDKTMLPMELTIDKENLCNDITSLSDPSNEFLSIQVASNGRFNSGSNIVNNKYPISFLWPNTPSSSYTTIRIDGVNYYYGTGGINLRPPKDISKFVNVSAWKYGDIIVEQTVKIVFNPYTKRMDLGKYMYKIKNIGQVKHTVGIRIMIDTYVKNTDAPTFVIPKIGKLFYETEFLCPDIPKFWQAFANYPADLNTVALGIFKWTCKDISPSRVIFGGWSSLYSNPWNYTIRPNYSLSFDNAVAIYWNEHSLFPCDSKEYFTFYGLGYVAQ